jgi:hypothetical protein
METAIFCCRVLEVKKTTCRPAVEQGGVKAGRRLAQTGGGLGQQMPARFQGLADGVNHKLLPRPEMFVGEEQGGGGGGLLRPDFRLIPPNGQQCAQPRAQLPLHGLFVIGRFHRQFLGRGQVHIDQRAGHGRVPHPPP